MKLTTLRWPQHSKLAASLLLAVVVIVTAAAAVLWWWQIDSRYSLAELTFGPGSREMVGSVPSPDGLSEAYIIRIATGGALSSFSWEIIVAPVQLGEGAADRRGWIWESYGCPPEELLWDGPGRVRVRVTCGDFVRLVRTNERNGMTAVTFADTRPAWPARVPNRPQPRQR